MVLNNYGHVTTKVCIWLIFFFTVSLMVIDKAGQRFLLVASVFIVFLSLSVTGATKRTLWPAPWCSTTYGHATTKAYIDWFIFSVSLVVIDKAGRRVLLVVSGIVMFLSLSVIGAYFYVIYEIDSSMEQKLSWLPLGDSYLTFAIAKVIYPVISLYIAFGLLSASPKAM